MSNTINDNRITAAQVDASRRMNALRTGWFSRDLRVAPGKEQLYLEYEEAWHDELAPQGLLEEETFTDFLHASWHKREIIGAQDELKHSAAPDRLRRYERDFERRATRALGELRRLQTERAARSSAAAPGTPEAA